METSLMRLMKVERSRTYGMRVTQTGWKWEKAVKMQQMESLMQRRRCIPRKFGEKVD